MKGRVYDPKQARFLTPDPIVAAPTSSLAYNRYAYAWNNPLDVTDPSGFEPVDETADIAGPEESIDITVIGPPCTNPRHHHAAEQPSAQYDDNGLLFAPPGPGGADTIYDVAPPSQFHRLRSTPLGTLIEGELDGLDEMHDVTVAYATGNVSAFCATCSNDWDDLDAGPGSFTAQYAEMTAYSRAVGHFSVATTGHFLDLVGMATLGIGPGGVVRVEEGALGAEEFAPSSRALGAALEEAGVARGAGEAAHHIVASFAEAATPARAVLQRFGIGINDAANGVFLPGNLAAENAAGAAVHSTLHSAEYYRAVNAALGGATSREGALLLLKDIGESLSGGGFR